jgi:hypothetical protein
VVSVFLQQVQRRKADSMLLSPCLEVARVLRGGENRAPWQHFLRQYNPAVRIMCALGAFVDSPPPVAHAAATPALFGPYGAPASALGGGAAGAHVFRTDGEGFPTGGAPLAPSVFRDEDFAFDNGPPAAGPLAPLVSASGTWCGVAGGGASLLRSREPAADAGGNDFDFS